MELLKRYGRGTWFVKFIFPLKPGKQTNKLPADKDLGKIIIKAKTRNEIGQILRKYHAAMAYCRHNPDEKNYPLYGYRWIASRNASVLIVTIRKDNWRCYIKKYDFCYHRAGFLTPEKKYICSIMYGYQQLF